MNAVNNGFVLNGLDSFSKPELDAFWEALDPSDGRAKILSVGLSCSFRCNYKCRYCYADQKKIPFPDELTLEEQKDIITQAKELGARTVVICGDGDPLVDKNLPAMVVHANGFGMTSIVVTNAAVMGDDRLAEKYHGMTGEELAGHLYRNGASMMIKLDSVNPEKYDEIVGVEGAFRKLERTLDRMKRLGFFCGRDGGKGGLTRVAFSAVVMKDTLAEVSEMRKFADGIGAQFICKLPTLVGNALKHLGFMFPAESYDTIRPCFEKYTAKRETLMTDTPRCIAWHYGPVIDIRGEVKECYTSACQNGRIGNVRETPLKELIEKRHRLYDIATDDFCPVKTRINKELIAEGKPELCQVLPENTSGVLTGGGMRKGPPRPQT